MSVTNGQVANQGTFNNAFMSRTVNDSTVGIKDFQNTAEAGDNVGSIKTQGGLYVAKKIYAKGQAQLLAGVAVDGVADSGSTGSAQDVTLTKPFTVFTNNSLVSIRNLTLSAGMALAAMIVLKNGQTGSLKLINNTGGTAGNRILTGTGIDLTLAPGASVFLIYDIVNSRWQVVGGSGASGMVPTGTRFTLPDNANTDVTGLLFDSAVLRKSKVEWTVYRETTGVGANVRVACGSFYVLFNGTNWLLIPGPEAEDAGTTFYISNAGTGQVAALTDAGTGTYDASKAILTWDIVHSTGI